MAWRAAPRATAFAFATAAPTGAATLRRATRALQNKINLALCTIDLLLISEQVDRVLVENKLSARGPLDGSLLASDRVDLARRQETAHTLNLRGYLVLGAQIRGGRADGRLRANKFEPMRRPETERNSHASTRHAIFYAGHVIFNAALSVRRYVN